MIAFWESQETTHTPMNYETEPSRDMQNEHGRLTAEVVRELLTELQTCVTFYPETVERTGATLDELIDGTAFFPGGAGVWRGEVCHGPLPPHFPVRPLMLVGHNFDSKRAFEKSKAPGGERQYPFWTTLKAILSAAGVNLSDCFFTNALMGLQPGSASGPMPRCAGYKEQCRAFLARQVEIVQPRALAALGNASKEELRKAAKAFPELGRLPTAHLMHPSTRPWSQKPDRQTWVAAQAAKLRAVVSG